MTSQSPEPIPGWAKERACELANAEPLNAVDYRPQYCDTSSGYGAIRVLARYIAEHEEAPAAPNATQVDCLHCSGEGWLWSYSKRAEVPCHACEGLGSPDAMLAHRELGRANK